MLNLFKKKTELEILKKEFGFLERQFGYILKTEETQNFYKGKNLVIYSSDSANKQIEICGGHSFFHCIIRRITDGELAGYNNDIENIGFEDLALSDNPKYDHFDFYAGGSLGVNGVTKNTVKLFKRQKTFLTTNKWIDIDKIEALKNEDFKSKFGIDRTKRESFKDRITRMIKEDFKEFQLIFDNDSLPFYHDDSTLKQITFKFEGNEIKIRQEDWRDSPHIYRVLINDSLIDEFDSFEENASEKIKRACIKLYNT